MTILILGGTARARALATRLSKRGPVVYSLAGVTEQPRLPTGCTIRRGPFGGVEGLVRFIQSAGIERLIDASHPHARQISDNAAAASQASGIPLTVARWRPWAPDLGDRWRSFADTAAMRDALHQRAPSRVLLALGAKASQPLLALPGHHLWLRCVEPPDLQHAGSPVSVIQARGPFSEAAEHELLSAQRIDLVICKNSGLPQGRAKLNAARTLGIEVWLLQTPNTNESTA
ncbi:MAG: precorrin-6A/cobalt-precorrin-6A reductase [Pseudomonadota bacterium]